MTTQTEKLLERLEDAANQVISHEHLEIMSCRSGIYSQWKVMIYPADIRQLANDFRELQADNERMRQLVESVAKYTIETLTP